MDVEGCRVGARRFEKTRFHAMIPRFSKSENSEIKSHPRRRITTSPSPQRSNGNLSSSQSRDTIDLVHVSPQSHRLNQRMTYVPNSNDSHAKSCTYVTQNSHSEPENDICTMINWATRSKPCTCVTSEFSRWPK